METKGLLPIQLALPLSFILLLHCSHSSPVLDSLEFGASLTGNHTIISQNGTFELGFFTPNGSNSNNWYIGIWYAQYISEKTIVWVANRETPVKNRPGVLNFSRDGRLRLFDLQGQSIWWTDNNLKASRAFILESGNLVMVGAHNNSDIVWESFSHPGDTWLPGMKMWKGMKLTCWKSSVDPAPGPFSLGMDPSPGKTQFLLLYNNTVQYWSSGEWIRDHFANLPETQNTGWFQHSFVTISPSRMYFTYNTLPMSQTSTPRVVMEKNGDARAWILIYNSIWSLMWSEPRDQCHVYDLCGKYGVCKNNNIQFCSCLNGFTPKDGRAWESKEWQSSGCVRRSPLQCSATNGTTDGFLQVTNKSLPDGQAVSYTRVQTLQGCRTACLNNCSCTAFVITPICRLWFGDLLNLYESSAGQMLFIRLAASDLETSRSRAPALSILLPAAAAVLALALLLAMFIRWSRGRVVKKSTEDADALPRSLRTFTYKELKIATKNFKHKLGSGAFGSVFKGTLPGNTLVAVKKLESSGHAEKQFRAEISTIGHIQHVNLVRLEGFCTEGSRRLLVYEYMPNGSLNSLLFCKDSEQVLEWKTRFKIALGTARGLVYLHEECRDRIIHCDIKPENILLDEDMSPKVADFCLAKLVGRDFSRVLTTTRGTRGYLAPEWISGLHITPKADVYSFGMTLLEIISGRRNLELNMQESSRLYFPTWAASEIEKGNVRGIVDPKIAKDIDVEEARRAAAVGQLCIEEDENARPSMREVVQILEGTIEANPPQIRRSPQETLEEDQGFDFPSSWLSSI